MHNSTIDPGVTEILRTKLGG